MIEIFATGKSVSLVENSGVNGTTFTGCVSMATTVELVGGASRANLGGGSDHNVPPEPPFTYSATVKISEREKLVG